MEYNKLARSETFLSSWADLVNRLKSAKQRRSAVSDNPLADMFRWKASNSRKYELFDSVSAQPQEGLNCRIAQLKLEQLEYVTLCLKKLLLSVGIVSDVAEVLRMRGADLFVLPASTPTKVPNSILKSPISKQQSSKKMQCGGGALTRR